MIIIIGLVILVAAVVAGVVGVLSNSGSGHPLTHHFAALGYHVTGSTGTLFLYGIVVGALAMLGLSLLLAGARRTSRRGHEARRGLRQSRRETAAVSQDRDDLLGQRETARAYAASTLGNGHANGDRRPGGDGVQRGEDDGQPGGDDRQPGGDGGQRGKWHLFGTRSASPQADDPPAQTINGRGPDVPADASPVASD
jgi:hypothetical protein